ncbi:MAG: hypothetical protein WC850_05660 [Candidatus Gracilibacteria bacterium]
MKNINFVVREIGEIYSLDFIISEFLKYGIKWNVYVVPYNSDLKLMNVSDIFSKYQNVSVINGENGLNQKCLGFKTDISGKYEKCIKSEIDVYKLASCMPSDLGINLDSVERYEIIVSNVKINDKNPNKEYNPQMWQLLGQLPYKIAVVPRHPFPHNFLNNIDIPKNVTIINKVGVLKSLCAKTSLVVMGKIFSNPEGEMDHSPLEATIRSNAISGYYSKIEKAYQKFYEESGLIHRYKSFSDSIEDIPELINDVNLYHKLENKKNWIEKNKQIYMSRVLNILLNI